MDQFGYSVGVRRRALNISQAQLGLAIGRSQVWVSNLENSRLFKPATPTEKSRIEAYLREREQPLEIPSAPPRRARRAPR